MITVNYGRWLAICAGILLGVVALAFFRSEGLVEFYRLGTGLGGSSAASSGDAGAVTV